MHTKDLYWLILTIFMANGTHAMTKEQLKKAGKMMKTNCIKKIQVAEDMIENIGQGKFIEDPKVMCYIACLYETMNTIKNNKINVQASIKQIDMMYPAELKESAKEAFMACKDVQKNYKDICEASYWSAKCMYDFKPEAFIFP